MAKIYVVLGMHRGGTSAVAGSLAKLGIATGGPLMAAAADNPAGFFELSSVHQIHEDFLQEISHPWDDPRPINFAQLDDRTLERATEALVSALGNDLALNSDGPFVVKDPRITRLLPLWDRVLSTLDLEPYFVIAHRHPAEVATSLAERAGCSVERATSLWLAHMVDAEAGTRGRNRGFIDYHQLLGAPVNALRMLSEQIDTVFPVNPPTAKPQLTSFLVKDLHRQTDTSVALGPLGDAAVSFHNLMQRCAMGHVSQDDITNAAMAHQASLVDKNAPEQASIEHASALATRLGRDIDELRQIIDERSRWMRSLSDRLTNIEERLDLMSPNSSGVVTGGESEEWMRAITDSIRNLEAEHGKWLAQLSSDTNEHASHILRIQREVVAAAGQRSLPRKALGKVKRMGLEAVERQRIEALRAGVSTSPENSLAAPASYGAPADVVAQIGEREGSPTSNGHSPKDVPAGS